MTETQRIFFSENTTRKRKETNSLILSALYFWIISLVMPSLRRQRMLVLCFCRVLDCFRTVCFLSERPNVFLFFCFHNCFGEVASGWKGFFTRQCIIIPSNSKLLNLCDGVFLYSGDSNLIDFNSESPRMQRPQPILDYQPDHEEDTGVRLRRGCYMKLIYVN